MCKQESYQVPDYLHNNPPGRDISLRAGDEPADDLTQGSPLCVTVDPTREHRVLSPENQQELRERLRIINPIP